MHLKNILLGREYIWEKTSILNIKWVVNVNYYKIISNALFGVVAKKETLKLIVEFVDEIFYKYLLIAFYLIDVQFTLHAYSCIIIILLFVSDNM